MFEGIPTSGKTVLKDLVARIFSGQKRTVEDISKEEFHQPFLARNDPKDQSPFDNASGHLLSLLQQHTKKNPDIILSFHSPFFYLATNNMRGKKETLLHEYHEVESFLEIFPTLIVYLEIEGRYILPCFQKRLARNDETDIFPELLQAKGTEFSQLAYYQRKQGIYNEQLSRTKLHFLHLHIKKETKYEELAELVVRKIRELEGGFGR